MMHSSTIINTKPAVAPGAILIVDDEAAIRQGLTAVLAREGHQVSAASGIDEACTQNYIQEHTLHCAPDEVLCS